MVKLEIDETIDRPIEEVFERLVDIDAYPRWLPRSRVFRSCHKTSAGPVVEGTTYVDDTRFGKAFGDVVDFEPPDRVIFRYRMRFLGMELMEGRPGYVLEALGAGRTRVPHLAEAKLRGAFKVLKPTIRASPATSAAGPCAS